jgi:peptidoglycan/LPS O-acetylase OafA/YrhL
MRPQVIDSYRHSRLLAASLVWLLIGSLLLASTLVPAHTEWLGWGPMFWLLGAPLAVALTLEPSLPRQLLALCRPRRRNSSPLIWH